MKWRRRRSLSRATQPATFFSTSKAQPPRSSSTSPSLKSSILKFTLCLLSQVSRTRLAPRSFAICSRPFDAADQVGSLLFCPSCGALLDVPSDEDVVKCAPCGGIVDAKG